MANETIIRNWDAILASLPPNALITKAEFKLLPFRFNGEKPEFKTFESFSPYSVPDLTEIRRSSIERIYLAFDYEKNGCSYNFEVTLYFDGKIKIDKIYGPLNEEPEHVVYPRCYFNPDELRDVITNNQAVFIQEWLEDFLGVINSTPNLKGRFVTTNEAYDPSISPKAWAKRMANRIHYGSSRPILFEAVLERPSTRSDFVDRITVQLKSNRSVYAEYRTYERENYAHSAVAQHIIGAAHEGKHLKLLSDIFPYGFAERKDSDFLYRCVNYSTNTCELRPWPNRQRK